MWSVSSSLEAGLHTEFRATPSSGEELFWEFDIVVHTFWEEPCFVPYPFRVQTDAPSHPHLLPSHFPLVSPVFCHHRRVESRCPLRGLCIGHAELTWVSNCLGSMFCSEASWQKKSNQKGIQDCQWHRVYAISPNSKSSGHLCSFFRRI